MPRQPNVLILHTDQQRFDSMGCTGSVSARTPALDALAGEGVCCTRHIATCPVCQPSRASLLTGLYPPGHGLWANGVSLPRLRHEPEATDRFAQRADGPGFRYVAPTIGDVFAAAGYRTAAFGKLHLTPYLEHDPSRRECFAAWYDGGDHPDEEPYYGFQSYAPILGHGPVNHSRHGGAYGRYLQQHFPHLREELPDLIAAQRFMPEIGDCYPSPLPHAHSDAAWLADRFTDFLAQRSEAQPFCCFIGFPGPHHPFAPSHDILPEFLEAAVAAPAAQAADLARRPLLNAFVQGDQVPCLPEPAAAAARLIRRCTDAMVHEIDRAVGRIVQGLRSAGVWDETIIVFTSDHGDFLGDFGLFRKTCLNAAQLLRVPCILRIPGHEQGALAEQAHRPSSSTDLLPTLAAAAGVPLPAPVHGVDLLQEQPADRCVFAYAHQAMNSTSDDRRLDNMAVIQGDEHYIHAPQAGLEELFDLAADPDERQDLAPERPQRCAELRDAVAGGLLRHYLPVLGKDAKY
jgi:arylsulfatase A-like enzyme